jgi:hypothetical protein
MALANLSDDDDGSGGGENGNSKSLNKQGHALTQLVEALCCSTESGSVSH